MVGNFHSGAGLRRFGPRRSKVFFPGFFLPPHYFWPGPLLGPEKMENDLVSIPLSKSKIVFSLLASLAFVAGGIWIFGPMAGDSDRLDPLAAKTIGILSIMFFGATGITAARKLFDNQPGLIINEEGVFDNSSGVSAGMIPWNDITGFEKFQVMSTKLLLIRVRNPDAYVSRVTNRFKARIMAANSASYGTPISISPHSLDIRFEQLLALLESKRKQYSTAG
jgi:hypothetical protein